jgi:elongation factor G
MEFPEPVIDIAIEPKTKADQDKLGTSLAKLAVEDPSSFRVRTDPESGQALIAGMGELTSRIIVDRLLRVQGGGQRQQAAGGLPGTDHPDRRGARAVHPPERGKGQYGDIVFQLSPNATGKGFTSESSIVGGKVPREFVRAAFRGAQESMSNGPLAGYPMVDIHVEAVDGSFHDVDSSEVAFKIAGSMALREGASKAGPALLEPVMSIEVVTPEEFMGDVIGDLNARRGRCWAWSRRAGPSTSRARSRWRRCSARHRPPLTDPGPGDVHHAVQPLCAGAEAGGRRIIGRIHGH